MSPHPLTNFENKNIKMNLNLTTVFIQEIIYQK